MTWLIKNGESVNVKVSSVLNRDVKQFGKKYITDGEEDTCWNSDEGSPQWVHIQLSKSFPITGFSIQFQGGFVGQNCRIELTDASEENHSEPFYPEDNNSLQLFKLNSSVSAKQLKLIFEKSTDFFGRIVIYSVDISTS